MNLRLWEVKGLLERSLEPDIVAPADDDMLCDAVSAILAVAAGQRGQPLSGGEQNEWVAIAAGCVRLGQAYALLEKERA